jgi:alpha-tubulin suppressor-like RCC1 family protein
VKGPPVPNSRSTFTCAITFDDKVKCWGDNSVGTSGQGNTNDIGDGTSEMGANLPFVNLGTGRTVKQVAAGWVHACAILDNNALKCWGHGNFGKLGLGDTLS